MEEEEGFEGEEVGSGRGGARMDVTAGERGSGSCGVMAYSRELTGCSCVTARGAGAGWSDLVLGKHAATSPSYRMTSPIASLNDDDGR